MTFSGGLWAILLVFHALFCSSSAFSNAARLSFHRHRTTARPAGSHRRTHRRKTCALWESSPFEQVATEKNLFDDTCLKNDERQSKRTISVESALVVPFSQTTAFDAFSDLTRQVDYSPWLRSVTYLNPPDDLVDTRGKDLGETKWTMAYMGVRFSWNSIVSRLDRPSILEWKSTSGMKNFGKVNFDPIDDSNTKVTFQMSFVAPRLVAALFRRSNKMAHFVQDKVIRTTLINFRDTIAKELHENQVHSNH